MILSLSNFFNKKDIYTNNTFNVLDNTNSKFKNTLAYCDNLSNIEIANNNKNITCILINKKFKNKIKKEKGVIFANNPRNTFYDLHHTLIKKNLYKKIKFNKIGKNCNIHDSAIISKKSYIGNNVKINENVIIKDNVYIDDNTFIDSGSVIGCGSVFFLEKNNKVKLIEHAGGLKIGKNNIVLSNSIISKSIFPHNLSTIGNNCVFGLGTKIGHNINIGNNVYILSNCNLSRGVKIDNYAWIGSSSSIKEYLHIGQYAKIMIGSVVVNNVASYSQVSGNFASNHLKRIKQYKKINMKK
tara:strand:- start:14210 stop:15103 length:894 start_codon:yes stop_codon:yes gene_type:complete